MPSRSKQGQRPRRPEVISSVVGTGQQTNMKGIKKTGKKKKDKMDKKMNVQSNVLRAVLLKGAIFRYTMLNSLPKVNKRFRGILPASSG
jgi:hypothetical protein